MIKEKRTEEIWTEFNEKQLIIKFAMEKESNCTNFLDISICSRKK
jgi:hypothetical protein